MRFLCLMLVACSAAAQLPVVPVAPKTDQNPVFLANLAYRWVSSDLTTNSAITGNWTDRIQSASWTQGNSSLRPTNSATGVWFDENHYLTNPGLSSFAFSNIAVGFIMNLVAPAAGGQVHPSLLNNTRTISSDGSTVRGYMFNFNSSLYDLVVQSQGSFANQISESPYQTTNAFSDMIISENVTNLGTGSFTWRRDCYTNGIADQKVSGGGSSIVWWGGSVASPNIPDSLGFNRARSSSARFRLLELWVWTNSLPNGTNGQPLDSGSISNFHYYRTNTYPF